MCINMDELISAKIVLKGMSKNNKKEKIKRTNDV